MLELRWYPFRALFLTVFAAGFVVLIASPIYAGVNRASVIVDRITAPRVQAAQAQAQATRSEK